jgi:hypothetical protein
MIANWPDTTISKIVLTPASSTEELMKEFMSDCALSNGAHIELAQLQSRRVAFFRKSGRQTSQPEA